MALGLGAGVSFYYVPIDGQSPSRFINGRVGRLEEQFVELTGAPIKLDTFEDRSVLGGGAGHGRRRAPAILLTDLYYLDHYGSSARFPGHAVVLAGYDAELAYLSDTSFEELQTTRFDNLARARHGNHPVFPLKGHMFTIAEGADSVTSAGLRVARSSESPPDDRAADGRVRGPARPCVASPPRSGEWPSRFDDWQWCARFCYQVIERRGTGGGNFRLMYSRFLEEAGRKRPALRPRSGRGGRRWPKRPVCRQRVRQAHPEPVVAGA